MNALVFADVNYAAIGQGTHSHTRTKKTNYNRKRGVHADPFMGAKELMSFLFK